MTFGQSFLKVIKEDLRHKGMVLILSGCLFVT